MITAADLSAIEPFLHKYGAIAVFASVFVEAIGGWTPSETLIVIAALLASSDTIWVWNVILAAWLGAVAGGVIGYLGGRYGGLPALKRYGHRLHIKPDTLERMQARIRGNGITLVFIAQFLPFLRPLKGVAAGTASMPWPIYMFANVAGSGVWALAWGGGAYILGSRVSGLRELVGEHALIIFLVPFILALAAAVGVYWRSRRGSSAMR